MAKRKKKNSWFSFDRKKKSRRTSKKFNWKIFIILTSLTITFAAIATGLFYLERYVKKQAVPENNIATFDLVDVPEWVNDELKEVILAKAQLGLARVSLDKYAARLVAQNLIDFPWLKDVKVQTAHDSIKIKALYRKPLAWVKYRDKKLYLDSDSILLNYISIPNLNTVEITGVNSSILAAVGSQWQREDVHAAIKLIELLASMDQLTSPTKPLLAEIASIDVSNFQGRRNHSRPYIILRAYDSTEIFWGAAPGQAAVNLEATEREKLEKLYEFYKQNGTLNGSVKYIELRIPSKKVPHPINSY